MSFNENHIISLSNYEEWFILYMDEELSAEQKTMVDNFLLGHPHLQDELDLLLSTKLPAEDIHFSGKEELQAAAMKLNTVDESLLLYIDNELPAAERKAVEAKISSSKDYRLQYELLQGSKLDASDVIPYPNKKELYRYTKRAVFFPLWMRIAVAVVMVLFGSYLFLYNPVSKPVTPDFAVIEYKPAAPQKLSVPAGNKPDAVPLQQTDLAAKTGTGIKEEKREKKPAQLASRVKENTPKQLRAVDPQAEAIAIQQVDAIQLELSKLKAPSSPIVNNSVANLSVTSARVPALNNTEDPEEPAVTDGDDKPKRTPAKGFLRKVSRFIERRTGIGTVNADNELLVGAVAFKLN
jgi:hypothetical protein